MRRSGRARAPFSGWRMAALAAVMLALTGPGQTTGVSVFVNPMMGALDLTRSEVSVAYLVGTLIASFALTRIGRALDEYGTRRIDDESEPAPQTVHAVRLPVPGATALGCCSVTDRCRWTATILCCALEGPISGPWCPSPPRFRGVRPARDSSVVSAWGGRRNRSR